MKLIIAPDSFKESLGANAVAEAIAAGWASVYPDAEIGLFPMADGGEGTVDALLAALGGERREARVSGPLGEPVLAHWGWLGGGLAVIEVAAASGLQCVRVDQRDAFRASSQGTGQLIAAALNAGATRIILGLGGSATNDAGAGLLSALGARFLDTQNQPLAPGGGALQALHSIDLDGLDARLSEVEFLVAADVDNPLCGPRGASCVFGPQKGANALQVQQLDQALGRFADVLADTIKVDLRNEPGVGAAGGLGFAALAILRARFRPGIELVAEVCGLARAIQGADLVITGEGRLDGQSLHGKTPVGVARIAQAAGVPVIALAGSLGEGYQRLYEAGIDAAFSLTPGPMALDYAMAHAATQLQARAADLARLWRVAKG